MSIAHEVVGMGDSPRVKFLWGGMGGLAPYFAALPFLGVDRIAQRLATLDYSYAAGYAVLVIILFVVGGVWALLHKTESDPLKLFQLGIVAPSMIYGMINAANVDPFKGHDDQKLAVSFGLSLISPAYAQSAPQTPPAPQPKPPADALDSFVKGLLGR